MTLTDTFKSRIKRLIAALLYWSGVLWLLARHRLRGKAVVLMYHRVLPDAGIRTSFSHAGIIVTPASFDRQIAFLKRHFRPVSLSDFTAHVEDGRPFPERACLVTFDDGWSDNHTHALPILRRHDVPAVVFAATDYIGSEKTFWQEELGHLLYEASRDQAAQAVLRDQALDLGDPENEEALRRAVAATVDRFRSEPYEVIRALISQLRNALACSGEVEAAGPVDQFMTWSHLDELSRNGVAIASHTCSHRILTRIEENSIRQELVQSRAELGNRLQQRVAALAYPGGGYDEGVARIASDAGYRIAFTTDTGPTSLGADPMRIPRINIHESASCTTPLFLARIVGLL